jgi:folate-binding protein YgfZ
MLRSDMPDVEAELDCAQLGALQVELQAGTIVVRGPDRQTWLNGLITQDLAPKKPGDAAYGLIVGKTGRIQSEAYVVLGDEDLLVGIPEAARAPLLVEALDRYLVMENAEIAVASDPVSWLLAFGLRAEDALVAARGAGARGGLIRRGGLPTAVLAFSPERREAVVAAVSEHAAPSVIASPEGWERVRIEHGIPERGPDWGDDTYPQEASLELDGVSFSKGCYLGQETVFMLEKRGHVKRRLVQLMVDGDVAVGDTLKDAEGNVVGAVTSRILRPGRNLALGYVKYKYAKSDTELVVGTASRGLVTVLLAIKTE